MTERTAIQLVGFGLALVAVGILNLAARRYDAARFRHNVSRLARRMPDRFDKLRSELLSEEGVDE